MASNANWHHVAGERLATEKGQSSVYGVEMSPSHAVSLPRPGKERTFASEGQFESAEGFRLSGG